MDGGVLVFAQVMVVLVTSLASLVAIGLGTRVLWNWGSRRQPRMSEPLHDEHRLQRLESSVDAIAIEVERISEAQRFMVRLLGESASARRVEAGGDLMGPGKLGRVDTPH